MSEGSGDPSDSEGAVDNIFWGAAVVQEESESVLLVQESEKSTSLD
jgi:hypothetical protein